MVVHILKGLIVLLIFLVAVFLVLLLFFAAGRKSDFRRQESRIRALSEAAHPPHSLWDQGLDDSLPLNRLRYLATHNSYHVQADPLRLFCLNLGEPGEAAKLKYTHLPFTEQLELGIRSFEMDLRYRKGGFENTHVPLVDDRTHSPSFSLALEEIRLWSDRHRDHVPLIILIEIKEDWMILDPRLSPWDRTAMEVLEDEIRGVLGNRIITPGRISRDSGSVRRGLMDNGWPCLGESRGKMIFAYMVDENRTDLVPSDFLRNHERVGFLMTAPDSPEAAIIKRDDPTTADVKDLLAKGFILRTRADRDLIVPSDWAEPARESGAQIVSTDFPGGYPHIGNYSLSWKDLIEK